MDYYNRKIKEVYTELTTSDKGLSHDEASKRLEKFGFNELKETKKISPLQILIEQFQDPLVLILIAAAVISVGTGIYDHYAHGTDLLESLIDAVVIGAILVVNAILGFIQEYNAEKSIEALKKMASLKCLVIREGKEMIIEARELVPGDVIILAEGDKVPADSRLLDCVELQTLEAALTGESLPVKKDIIELSGNLAIGDRKNMVYSGTVVTSGKGRAVVCGTGMESEIGKIATLIEETKKEETPLQEQLEGLGKFLTKLVLGICVIVFVSGMMRGAELIVMFIYAVGLAVAAIPEGLPAVVTISLSLGVKRMVKRNALIRKLPSVETLGCTTVICSDKTGTLTHNEMTVKKVYVDGKIIEVGGSGYEPSGGFSEKPKDLDLILQIGALNNDARLSKEEDTNAYSIIGDPTEGALIVSAAKAGVDQELLNIKYERRDEIPFDHSRKMMTTVHMVDGSQYVYVKGAPDMLLERCTKIIMHGKAEKLTPQMKKDIQKTNEHFADHALRVLGFAYKELHSEIREKWEEELIFVGLQGMIDPPRQEVKEAIDKCKTAGIKVVMITGDYIGTAEAIAKDLGIEGRAVTGVELSTIDLDKEVMNIGIYARVNPEDKLKIVDAFQKKGHVVAMTGDGVNDAPALKKADLGIAMGKSGTDVAREASDMILTDDNFTSIVNAVEEGRTIYDNIRKFVVYLLSSNVGEVLTVFVALLIGLPLPVLVTQLLWINLVTDGLPATALSIDPAEKDIMKLKPRKKQSSIVNKQVGIFMFLIGVVMMVATIGVFYYAMHSRGWHFGTPIVMRGPNKSPADLILAYDYATTLAFTTLVMLQMFNVLNARNLRRTILSNQLLSNRMLWVAIASSIALQCLVIYSPLNKFFSTVPLGFLDWIIIMAASISVIFAGELLKVAGLRNEE